MEPMVEQQSEFLSIEDIALRLNVSSQLIYKLITAGNLRAVRFGARILVRRSVLESFIQQCEYSASSQQ
jgi:excisionase family DNA binding protein